MPAPKSEAELYEVKVLRGQQLFSFGKKEDAEQELFAAIALQPDKPLAYIALADCYINWPQRHDKALDLIQRTLALAPQSPHLMTLESIALQRKSRLGEALAAAELALRVNPCDAFALNQRTLVLNEIGMPDQALENARKAWELNPTNLNVGLFWYGF